MQQPPNPYPQNPQYPQQQWQQPQMPPPQQYQQQPQYQPPMPPSPKKRSRKRLWLILAAVVLVLAIIIGVSSKGQNPQSASTTQPTQSIQASQPPTEKSTSQPVHYPPTTLADLQGLAAKGDASAIHEFHSESVGLVGACPQPKREVTVAPSLTGQQLAEDLLAYFYTNQLNNPCGSLVLVYHNQAEAGNAYTAGRIGLDVTDSSGAPNTDPNATGLKYTLTLDIGDVATGQEYTVTY